MYLNLRDEVTVEPVTTHRIVTFDVFKYKLVMFNFNFFIYRIVTFDVFKFYWSKNAVHMWSYRIVTFDVFK